jgi:hypothetical protein
MGAAAVGKLDQRSHRQGKLLDDARLAWRDDTPLPFGQASFP